jgi:alkylated DNA repair protein (DNA oxidative demethylase)
MRDAEDGRSPIAEPGFTYSPHFISKDESEELIAYFGSLQPLWEQRFRDTQKERSKDHGRRLTRPVYWLGAWQFATLGYYAEPDHREHRCLRAEGFPQVMADILERCRPMLAENHRRKESEALPTTCLINYYGREVSEGVHRDYARLRMHRDGEPGPVIMFNIGQAGLLEFLDPELSPDPELRLWTRHRSLSILSGPDYKDRLYHRITQVRTGDIPEMHTRLANFELRRISVSFRHVPPELIEEFSELPSSAQEQIRDYVETLAEDSPHYRDQLEGASEEPA